jgi:hypothetical protein
VIARKPEAEAETARRRLRQKAAKRGKTLDARSLEAAGFVLLLTTLPAGEVAAGDILALYRFRWQIELVFKRWKSLLDLDRLPAHSAPLARCWLYTKILAILMVEDWGNQILESPPSGPGIDPLPAVRLARHRHPGPGHPADYPGTVLSRETARQLPAPAPLHRGRQTKTAQANGRFSHTDPLT